MEELDILNKLKKEFKILIEISDRQFEQRFSTSKYENKWSDDLFERYQTSRTRINLLLELLI